MSDIGDTYKALREEDKRDREQNRQQATHDFTAAVELANQHGMGLIRRSDTHYQINHIDGWLLNLYPGNQRLYGDRNRRVKAPSVDLHIAAEEMRCWTLLDVVHSLVRAGHGRKV